MKVCSACGYNCDDDAEFCAKCGEYFPKPGEAPKRPAQQIPGMPSMQPPQDSRPKDDFALTVDGWISKLKESGEPDDSEYARILDECTDAAFRAMAISGTNPRYSVCDLAILAGDHDLMTDILRAISERATRIGYQKELMNTANLYVFLAIDAFAVYTDLDDLVGICDDAVSVFAEMESRIDSLEPVQSRNDPKAFLQNYEAFFGILGDRLESMKASSTPERLEQLSDYWAERSGKRFSEVIMGAANMHVQLVGTGKLGSKIASKARDMQLEAFQRMYTSVKTSEEV